MMLGTGANLPQNAVLNTNLEREIYADYFENYKVDFNRVLKSFPRKR